MTPGVLDIEQGFDTLSSNDSIRMQCPKCQAAVRVTSAHAGKRLKCPKCGGVIKVPGNAATDQSNDDWLGFDEPAPQPVVKAGSAPMNPAESSWLDGLPPLNDADLRALQNAGGFAGADPFGDALPGANGLGVVGKDEDERLPEPAEPNVVKEYRAKCPVCESVHFVKPAQAGKTIHCSDCLSSFVVPPPPKPVLKRTIDIEKAPTFQLAAVEGERNQHDGVQAKSAAELLRAAEDEMANETDPKHEYANPDVSGWFRSTLGIFADPAVAAYWVGLSILMMAPGFLATMLSIKAVMGGSMIITAAFSSLVLTCAFAILEAVANGQNRVDEWPSFNPTEWFGNCFVAIVAAVLSSLPGAIASVPIFGVGIVSFGAVLFSVFALFPFVLLSMLDNGSVTMPVSAEVTKSVTRCKESWGILYFASMLLFGLEFLLMAMLSQVAHPIAALFFGCLLSVGACFIYFAMVGKLAFDIGQSINGGPNDSDIE